MLSLYVALGIFLLIGESPPDRLQSMVVFRSRRCYGVTEFSKGGYRGDLWGVAVLVIIGVTPIVLAPTKESGELASAAGA